MSLSSSSQWLVVIGLILPAFTHGILYPRESETRERKLLDGTWNFRIVPFLDQDIGFREEWYKKPLRSTGPTIPMPVPSSYNDVTQNRTIRDHIGWVWYDREFYAPSRWSGNNQRVYVHFGSAHYAARVYLNGKNVLNHTVGHLPFQARVDHLLKWNEKNLLTVAINNTLSRETIPTGSVTIRYDKALPNGYGVMFHEDFDFFNYAGLHRSVSLYAVPAAHIQDINIGTDVDFSPTHAAHVSYKLAIESSDPSLTPLVKILDAEGKMVASHQGQLNGTITLHDFKLWWPIFSHPEPGYQYTMRVSLLDGSQKEIDVYHERFGIRTVRVKGTQLLVNEKPVYLHGVAKHEDYDVSLNEMMMIN